MKTTKRRINIQKAQNTTTMEKEQKHRKYKDNTKENKDNKRKIETKLTVQTWKISTKVNRNKHRKQEE